MLWCETHHWDQKEEPETNVHQENDALQVRQDLDAKDIHDDRRGDNRCVKQSAVPSLIDICIVVED